jgi:hypothetical protein
MRGPERVVTARPSGVQRMVVSCRTGWVCIMNVPVGSMSRSRLMGSWLNVIKGWVHGERHGSGRMGFVEGTNPELNAVRAVGPEGVSLVVSWSCRQGAYWTSCRRVRSCCWPRSHQWHCHVTGP